MELAILTDTIRRQKLLFKNNNVTYSFLRVQLHSLSMLLPRESVTKTRAGVVKAMQAWCLPGWPGRPTIQAAIQHTRWRRDNPPPIVGKWTDDELSWFDRRIATMHEQRFVGKRTPLHTQVDA